MRRRGPGLVGMAARTAVVAGTATAASGRVARRQQAKFADKDAQQGAEGQQGAAEEMAAAQAPPPPPQDDVATQIQQLGELKDQGLLTEEEFAAKKKQILGI